MEILALFHKGGLVMYPLLLASIVVLAIFFERIKFYNQSESNMEVFVPALKENLLNNNLEGLKEACIKDGGMPARIIKTAVDNIHQKGSQSSILEGRAALEVNQLKRYLNYVEVVVTLSPLLGLLGTVTGMISSFSVLSIEQGQPFAITGGVGEALIATGTGLAVAIVALVFHTYLAHRVDKLVTDIEYVCSIYLTFIKGDSNEN